MLKWPTKDPDEKLDFSIDFSDRLASTDGIGSVVWSVPAGLVLVSQSQTTQIATVILSGGTLNTQYEVVATVTTTLGFILEQSVIEKIRSRTSGPMTFTVEDGSGLAAANSYVSEANAETYFKDRDVEDWHNYTGTNDKEAALVRGTAAIDALFRGSFSGYRKNGRDQALEWPRSQCEDREGNLVDEDAVPLEVVQATCEAALRELIEPGAMQPDLERGGDVRRMKAGSVEIEYGAGAGASTTHTIVAGILSSLMVGGGSGLFGRAARG